MLKTLDGTIIGENYALKQAAEAEPQQAAQRCRSFAAAMSGA